MCLYKVQKLVNFAAGSQVDIRMAVSRVGKGDLFLLLLLFSDQVVSDSLRPHGL